MEHKKVRDKIEISLKEPFRSRRFIPQSLFYVCLLRHDAKAKCMTPTNKIKDRDRLVA